MVGMHVVKKIEQIGTADGKPGQPVKIVDCGEPSEIKDEAVVEKEKGSELIKVIIGSTKARNKVFFLMPLHGSLTFFREKEKVEQDFIFRI